MGRGMTPEQCIQWSAWSLTILDWLDDLPDDVDPAYRAWFNDLRSMVFPFRMQRQVHPV